MAYVWMTHPGLPDNPPVQQPESAFEGRYRHQGWVLVEPPAVAEVASPDDPAPAEDPPAAAEKKTRPARAEKKE
jgi:hypothetical protein